MSVLEKLTEGIVNRDLQKEGAALLDKWERTGLLEGITNDSDRNGMARLLENQAKELLREASTMAAGDVEGFAAVAFPLVRRVFGGLIANDLVSVQPMSLPSGLIFFLDFTHQAEKLGQTTDSSLYGGGVVGQQLTGGISLNMDNDQLGPYNLSNGYSSPTGSVATLTVGAGFQISASAWADESILGDEKAMQAIRWDPDLSGSDITVFTVTGADTANWGQLNLKNLVAITASLGAQVATGQLVRRLTSIHSGSAAGDDPTSLTFKMVYQHSASADADDVAMATDKLIGRGSPTTCVFSYAINDNFAGTPAAGATEAIGAVVGADAWGLEAQADIPEIDLKVDSVSVTAMTKKLKARWTPELGQDLNAYHNLDAEVELTGILSEQIALEIDQEILNDLIQGATAGTLYWSRNAGQFVNRETGDEIGATTVAPDFTGTVSEWYETLCETINDVSARIHRKTLRGGANFIVCSPEVANLLEFTSGFRADVTGDSDRGSVGAVKVGSLSKKWDVYIDPYFPRNVVLVGRRGGSFLESGFVYAPYVPLQVTPTIFGIDDFTPRKGVMTRYAKKMVRPDMYGLVIVEHLTG